jgi:hypothetical protein
MPAFFGGYCGRLVFILWRTRLVHAVLMDVPSIKSLGHDRPKGQSGE